MAPGVPAHATPDPGQKWFYDHGVCWRTDKATLYDPSYCVAFNDGGDAGDEAIEEYEATMIDQYAPSGNGPWAPNPTGCQLR
jgi:hypothetical protein